MSILSILIVLIVCCLIWWGINSVLTAFGVGNPIATLVRVIFVILVVLWLLSLIGGPILRLS